MEWNVFRIDAQKGTLRVVNILEDEIFKSAIYNLIERNYGKKQFEKELRDAAKAFINSGSERELSLCEMFPKIITSEIPKIVNEYTETIKRGETPPKEVRIHPTVHFVVDIYDQLSINWEHFVKYIWEEGKKMITRAKLIGHKLDPECHNAKTTSQEYGIHDNRVFCYGLYERQSETDIREKCMKCKAYVFNAEPLRKERGVTKKDE